MRLLFLVQKTAWFFEHSQAWYRIRDIKEVSLALSGLPLNLINQHDLVEQPHQAGTASVSQRGESSLSIALRTPDNKLIDTIEVELDENILLNVDWKTKPFGDGWLSPEVMLTLDNVGSLYVDAYLPASNGSDGKTLTIVNTETGSSVDVWIARDRKSRIPIVEEGVEGKINLKLTCEPEKTNQPTDTRQLGFLMIEHEAWPV